MKHVGLVWRHDSVEKSTLFGSVGYGQVSKPTGSNDENGGREERTQREINEPRGGEKKERGEKVTMRLRS